MDLSIHKIERLMAKDLVRRTHQVHSILQSLSINLKKEISQIDKIKDNKISDKLRLADRKKSFEYFIKKGKMYLNLMNNLHDKNQKISSMFMIMSRAVDMYLRLKIKFEDTILYWTDDDVARSVDREDMDGIEYDELIYAGYETPDEFDYNTDSDSDAMDDAEIINSFEYIWALIERYYRETMLEKMESLITQIKILSVTFTKSTAWLYLVLYHVLRTYCKRVRLFLRGKAKLLRSSKPHPVNLLQNIHKYSYLRGKAKLLRSSKPHPVNLLQNIHKYSYLERLLKRLSEEQKYVARHACIMSIIRKKGKAKN